jgi:CBS domain-containing protein
MPRELPVRDVMTTDVVVFAESESVSDAVERLVTAGVDAGPVLDEGGAVVGMLSSTDLIVRESRMHLPTVISILGATIELPSQKRRFDEDLEKALGSSVAEVMGEEVHTVGPDDTVETAATQMHEHNVSRLPVVDDEGHLVGIIARGDILRAVVQAGQ